VAQSYLNTGDGSFSQYVGDMILSHDLATNASGKSVVVWDRMIVPQTYYYSAYMQLDAIRRLRIDESGNILADANPDNVIVSQNADTYEASPNPRVAINDTGAYAVAWTYAPDYNMSASQLPAARGIYARRGDWSGPVGNEFLVVASPNSDGRPSYPTPPQFYVGHINHPVAMDAAGNFLVGYFDSASQGITPDRLRGRLFGPDGAPRGDRFSFVEADSPYAQQGVGPEQFRLAMDADGDIAAAWGNPNPVPNTWVTVVGQRFVRADFVVQRGQAQRSTVQYLDITFNPGTVDLAGLTSGGRLQLTRYPLTGGSQGTPVSLAGTTSYAGNTLTFDFGAAGLSDGYYVLQADLDGDGVFEASWRFYRKAGDMSGTGLNSNPWIWFLLNG
jgi:hypothetical protein